MNELSRKKYIFIFIFISTASLLLVVSRLATGKVKSNVEMNTVNRSHEETGQTPTRNCTVAASHQHVPIKDQFWKQNESRSDRKRQIAKRCRNYSSVSKTIPLHEQLSKNNTVFYCGIPKVGTTFMTAFMLKTFNCSEYNACLSRLSNVNQDEYNVTKKLINQAYSLMFVREPYHRIFSAYENKLFHPNEFWRILGVPVIKTVRRNATRLSKQLGHDVTFAELVEYVVINHDRGVSINAHLAPMHTICNPCVINFDFIGRIETMSDDIEFILDEWKSNGIISKNTKPARTLEAQIRYSNAFGRIPHMFKRLHEYKSNVSRYKLFQRTWSSYQIGGLILNDYEMPYTEKEVGKIDKGKYTLAIKKALDKSKDNKKELKSQREEAFIEAYRSVPMDLLLRLREIMKPDCLLFGYDDTPDVIFNRKNFNTSSSFTYFNGMNDM